MLTSLAFSILFLPTPIDIQWQSTVWQVNSLRNMILAYFLLRKTNFRIFQLICGENFPIFQRCIINFDKLTHFYDWMGTELRSIGVVGKDERERILFTFSAVFAYFQHRSWEEDGEKLLIQMSNEKNREKKEIVGFCWGWALGPWESRNLFCWLLNIFAFLLFSHPWQSISCQWGKGSLSILRLQSNQLRAFVCLRKHRKCVKMEKCSPLSSENVWE